jgi:pimeloyl-ACP methyl ester carboxylesterase
MRRVLLAAIGLLITVTGWSQLALPPEGHVALVNGFEMYYEIHGQGRPLVLLHQFNGSGGTWEPFINEFARHYRLIVVDLRGHGRSTNPTNEFTHRQSALDVYALLDHLGIQQFQAMGISSGGMTLIHMATQQPVRAEALVLVGATTYFTDQDRAIKAKSTVEGLTKQDFERLRKIHLHGDEQIRTLRRQFHDSKDSYDDMNFTGPLLSTITARTLVVHGDRDAFFPVPIAMEMYRSIPTSYLWIVPNGGHVPIRQHAEEFTETVLAFLGGDWK